MTKTEIIAMARSIWPTQAVLPFPELEAFYHLAFAAGQAHEREECAKLVESNAKQCSPTGYVQEVLCSNAAAIRARGEK